MLHFCLGLLFAINEKSAPAAGAELAGFVSDELITHIHFAVGQLIARGDGIQFQTKKDKIWVKVACFEKKQKTAKKTAFGDNDSRQPGTKSEARSARIN